MKNTHLSPKKSNIQYAYIDLTIDEIIISTVDLLTKTDKLRIDSSRVSTIAYEIKYYPTNTKLFKILLSRVFTPDNTAPSDHHIHLIPHRLIQTTDETMIRNQILKNNEFYNRTTILPIYTRELMHIELLQNLMDLLSITGIKSIYLSEKEDKWTILTTKKIKIVYV